MSMVKGITVVDEPLLVMNRDKASEEADRVSKETILVFEEMRKGGGGERMETEEKRGGGGGSD